MSAQISRPLGRRCLASVLVLFLLGLSAGAAQAAASDGPLAHRWFFVSRGLDSDQAVEKACGLVDTAAAHGYTGMVYDPGFTGINEWPADWFPRLAKVKAHCDEKKIEIIPLVMSAGYGGGVHGIDRNLAEGLPVKGERYEVQGGVAKLVPDVAFSAAGGFEAAKGDEVRGLNAQDKPGKATFLDTKEVKVGKGSLRLEPGQNGGKVRLTKSLTKPGRHYLVRFWAKADGLKPSRLEICVYNESFQIQQIEFRLPENGEWAKIEFPVLTADNKETNVYIGTWNAKAGRFWIDGLEIAEPGLVNVLRRPGTPLVIAREGGEVFQEGKDYEKVVDPGLKPNQGYHTPPAIRIIAGGKIKDGDRLSVSYFAPPLLRKGQVVLCMSEPAVYDIWHKAVRKVEETVHPRTWFLDMDEVRGGGTCQACLDRKRPDGSHLAPGEILGDCITRQAAMIREGSPKAEVAIWSDMLDPNHNAVPQFFNVPGGYVGSWKFMPKDLIIACWNLDTAEKSLAHFSGLGFRTLAAAYYDADDLDGTKKWLEWLAKTPKATGIMYTTWEEKFKLLPDFGDLVAKSAP